MKIEMKKKERRNQEIKVASMFDGDTVERH